MGNILTSFSQHHTLLRRSPSTKVCQQVAAQLGRRTCTRPCCVVPHVGASLGQAVFGTKPMRPLHDRSLLGLCENANMMPPTPWHRSQASGGDAAGRRNRELGSGLTANTLESTALLEGVRILAPTRK